MASADAVVWLALGAAFVFGAIAFQAIAETTARRRKFARAHEEAFGDGARMNVLFRHGVRWCMPLADALMSLPSAARAFHEAEAMACSRGHATTARNLCSIWCAFSFAAVVIGTVLGASPVFGVASVACAGVVGWFVVERNGEMRERRMREGVPDVLRAMESCFFAGLSLMQTFQHLADEAPLPLDAMFSQAARGLEMGETPAAVLAAFRDQAGLPELSFVAIALEVQHDTGGSMKQVLAAARDSVESDLELRRSLQVQTAQAKLSARVVTAMPFVLVAVFSLITEDFLAPFFTSAVGLALLVLAITMQVAGVLSVRSMLKVGLD